MPRAVSTTEDPATAEGRRLLRDWRTDRRAFDARAEACIAGGWDAPLLAAGRLCTPNEREALTSALDLAAESMEREDGSFSRLVVVPALAHPDDGSAPDAVGVADALVESGLVPQGARVTLSARYHALDAVAALGRSGRRALLKALLVPAATVPAPVLQAIPPCGAARGTEVVVVGAVTLRGGPGEVPLLDADADFAEQRPMMAAMFRSGGGLVDVSLPGTAFELAVEGEFRWFAEESGAAGEIETFLASDGRAVRAELRPVRASREGLAELRLAAADGSTVDLLEFDPYDLPLSPGELRRVLEAAPLPFLELPMRPPRPFGTGRAPRPEGPVALRAVTGGRAEREEADRAAWHAGLRKRMAELRKPAGASE